LEVGSWKLAVGSWEFAVCSLQLGIEKIRKFKIDTKTNTFI
jgi:hypothetical protein